MMEFNLQKILNRSTLNLLVLLNQYMPPVSFWSLSLSFFPNRLNQLNQYMPLVSFSTPYRLVSQREYPAGIYKSKVNNRNTRTRCEICSKLTLKTPKRHHSNTPLKTSESLWFPDVFKGYGNSVVLVSLLLTSNIFHIFRWTYSYGFLTISGGIEVN